MTLRRQRGWVGFFAAVVAVVAVMHCTTHGPKPHLGPPPEYEPPEESESSLSGTLGPDGGGGGNPDARQPLATRRDGGMLQAAGARDGGAGR